MGQERYTFLLFFLFLLLLLLFPLSCPHHLYGMKLQEPHLHIGLGPLCSDKGNPQTFPLSPLSSFDVQFSVPRLPHGMQWAEHLQEGESELEVPTPTEAAATGSGSVSIVWVFKASMRVKMSSSIFLIREPLLCSCFFRK